MTEEESAPTEPDWIRWCKVRDLDSIQGQTYMLRESQAPSSPWRNVATRSEKFWQEELPAETEDGPSRVVSFEVMTVAFHGVDAERVLNFDDDVEVGLIRPPWWGPEQEPSPDWPRK
ncbi:hypothetical protein [Mycolicibacterium tokaiense]|uniref:Uncharacterized protein n=1 Tax=Mycolicibacterium tokaiense TaxID=39695 RepID=A0A378T9B3_9MYCO|nr:hypothetical protein [Mycolicibacterium tokaiense]BBY88461.1 hypothetical protein MTOK_42430 [Mycolicibacterium tokaiense]STZ57014.1 Uncharacterised protein [Mycolicibacterium tokaiense]